MDDGKEIGCPWCGEPFWIAIDQSGGGEQRFVTDCEICCRPIDVLARRRDDQSLDVEVAPEGG